MDEGLYKKIISELPVAYAIHKIISSDKVFFEDYEYLEVNNAFEKLTGLKREDIIGKRATEIIPNIKSNKSNIIEHYGNLALKNGKAEFIEYSEEFKKWYKIKLYFLEKNYFVTFFIDVTKEINEKNLYKGILSAIGEGVIAIDLDGTITMLNKTAEILLGLKSDDILNRKIRNIFKIKEDKENKDVNKIIREGKNLILRAKERKSIPIEYNLYPIKNQLESICGAVISFTDVTEKIAKEKEVDYMTYHDSLTGAYNRNFFNTEIENIDIKENLPISVIMGDVNGLKLTNDAFGHLMGDKLLVSAVNIMKRCCRNSDIIVRWGGDEFIIILPKTSKKDVQKIMERIKKECEKETVGIINMSISLGNHTKDNMQDDIMKSIINSEEIMYRIKVVESKNYKSKTLKIIMDALWQRSKFDAEHSKNVSNICKLIGESMALSQNEILELEMLGNIHDIGKIGISENILNKEDKLNEAEWIEMRKHPEIGYHIVSCSNEVSFLADSIIAHHEWYDGAGYPKGIKAEEIPLKARILCVADVFDTMTNYASYKKTLSKNQAINELIKLKGKQFDPNIVDIFVDNVVDKLN
ncbi:diguanylate cyclase [Clostridium cochlearium]|uniref:diguanylate cyclase n=1 Tax=Clostridium cochlearium TaxID=1494 RepID=UPI001EDE6D16|nr:diguanylate cyclase [Clostridium cochlearium]MCG4581035.1 diguanylate cyclase [Clostridium cochlearium]